MLTANYVKTMWDRWHELGRWYYEMSQQHLWAGGPRVEMQLADGTVYRVAALESDPGDGAVTILAWGDPPRVVSIPYESIVRIEAFEPSTGERGEQRMGFQHSGGPKV